MTRSSTATVLGRAVGLVAIALLQAYWFLQPLPVAAKVLATGFAVLSVTRPASGLLVLAGLAPLSTAVASLCGGGAGLGAQLLEQLALGIGAGVLVRGRSTEGRTRIGAPALFMAVVAIASAVALIPAAAAPVARSLGDGLLLKQLALRQTAQTSPVWAPLLTALTIAECALLGWAVERTVRRDPPLATRLVALALIGHAGAGVLNFLAVLGGALRTGEALEALPKLLMSLRISRQTDWNAAASAFVIAGVSGLGLMNRSWRAGVGIGSLVGLVAIGLWLTGSRVGIAAGMGGAVAVIAWSAAITGRRARFVVVGAAVVVLGVFAWLMVNNPSRRNDPLSGSVAFRREMMKAGIQMFEQAPVFGIGVSKFYEASAAYIGPYMQKVGGGPRENAHNNFVQVLAEQGVTGLAAMLWWLAAVVVYGARGRGTHPDLATRALLVAVVACICTWLTGHPLLVPEFAFVFWLYCGMLAGLTPAVRSTWPRWPVGLLVGAILITVPFRASALRDAVWLEHLGFGLSLWQHDDAQRYREVGPDFALYLPANGRPVELPIRLAPGAPHPLVMEVRLRGQLVESIPISDTAWQTASITLRQGARQFELVDFATRSPTPGTDLPAVLLRVGKNVLR